MSAFGTGASAITAGIAATISGPAGVTATPQVGPPPRRRGRPPKAHPPILADQAAGMIAAGVTPATIRSTLGISRNALHEIQRDPAIIEKIQAIRDTLREINLHGLHATTAKAYAMLNGMIDTGDAKGFQLTANGLANMERTAASAAGDARRIESSMQVDADVTAEAQALLLALIGTERS
mgnify:FL=1